MSNELLLELQQLLSDSGDLRLLISEQLLRILKIIDDIEVRRQYTLAAISNQDDEEWRTMSEEDQTELGRVVRVLSNPEARGRYLPIVIGWKRVVSCCCFCFSWMSIWSSWGITRCPVIGARSYQYPPGLPENQVATDQYLDTSDQYCLVVSQIIDQLEGDRATALEAMRLHFLENKVEKSGSETVDETDGAILATVDSSYRRRVSYGQGAKARKWSKVPLDGLVELTMDWTTRCSKALTSFEDISQVVSLRVESQCCPDTNRYFSSQYDNSDEELEQDPSSEKSQSPQAALSPSPEPHVHFSSPSATLPLTIIEETPPSPKNDEDDEVDNILEDLAKSDIVMAEVDFPTQRLQVEEKLSILSAITSIEDAVPPESSTQDFPPMHSTHPTSSSSVPVPNPQPTPVRLRAPSRSKSPQCLPPVSLFMSKLKASDFTASQPPGVQVSRNIADKISRGARASTDKLKLLEKQTGSEQKGTRDSESPKFRTLQQGSQDPTDYRKTSRDQSPGAYIRRAHSAGSSNFVSVPDVSMDTTFDETVDTSPPLPFPTPAQQRADLSVSNPFAEPSFASQSQSRTSPLPPLTSSVPDDSSMLYTQGQSQSFGSSSKSSEESQLSYLSTQSNERHLAEMKESTARAVALKVNSSTAGTCGDLDEVTKGGDKNGSNGAFGFDLSGMDHDESSDDEEVGTHEGEVNFVELERRGSAALDDEAAEAIAHQLIEEDLL